MNGVKETKGFVVSAGGPVRLCAHQHPWSDGLAIRIDPQHSYLLLDGEGGLSGSTKLSAIFDGETEDGDHELRIIERATSKDHSRLIVTVRDSEGTKLAEEEQNEINRPHHTAISAWLETLVQRWNRTIDHLARAHWQAPGRSWKTHALMDGGRPRLSPPAEASERREREVLQQFLLGGGRDLDALVRYQQRHEKHHQLQLKEHEEHARQALRIRRTREQWDQQLTDAIVSLRTDPEMALKHLRQRMVATPLAWEMPVTVVGDTFKPETVSLLIGLPAAEDVPARRFANRPGDITIDWRAMAPEDHEDFQARLEASVIVWAVRAVFESLSPRHLTLFIADLHSNTARRQIEVSTNDWASSWRAGLAIADARRLLQGALRLPGRVARENLTLRRSRDRTQTSPTSGV